MDSNNVHLSIERPVAGDTAGNEQPRPIPSPRPVPPSKGRLPAASHDALKIEKTTWQLSPEVQKVIESMTTPSSTASVRLDPESNRLIVEVRNSKTGELIREIPPEDLHRLAAKEGIQVGVTLDKMI
jgi:uncharacterized FlaG/YvyC family protein